jgi:hypothetical protein
MRKEIGADDDITDEELLDGNKAAFDPEFSHTIFINVLDPANPMLVDPPEGFLTKEKDYVLTWDDVQHLPDLYPDGNIIAANMDGIQMIFFPIPTKPQSGGLKRRKRKTRKARKSKGKRKQRQSKKYK